MEVTKRQFNKLFLVAAVAAFGRNSAVAESLNPDVEGTKTTSAQDLAFCAFRPSPAKNWAEQLACQRGIESVIWAMPAVSMAFFRDSAFKAST